MIKPLLISLSVLYLVLASCSKDDPIYRTIPGVYVQEEVSDTLMELQCYPNPAVDQTTISFRLTSQQKLNIRMFDRFGAMVFEKKDQVCMAGYNTLSIDVSGWAQGMYIMQVIVNKKSYSRQFVKG